MKPAEHRLALALLAGLLTAWLAILALALWSARLAPSESGTVAVLFTPGYDAERSYLDLELPAATYYIQIDGYNGQLGPWFLDVHVVDP